MSEVSEEGSNMTASSTNPVNWGFALLEDEEDLGIEEHTLFMTNLVDVRDREYGMVEAMSWDQSTAQFVSDAVGNSTMREWWNKYMFSECMENSWTCYVAGSKETSPIPDEIVEGLKSVGFRHLTRDQLMELYDEAPWRQE